MHETSLVRSLIRQVRQLSAQHGGGQVSEVLLEIGPLSGVEPLLLQSAWREQTAETEFALTVLNTPEVPLTAECGACARQFEPVNFHFRCPHCQSGETHIVRGEGLMLQSITLDQPSAGVEI
jgi:hydrogenase nickel incorporation protein HypA/HybF